MSRLWIHLLIVGQKIAGISRNRSQRGAQVMGYGSEKIGPKLFVFGQNSRFFLFLHIPDILQRQRALSEDGQKNTVFKGIQRTVFHIDAYNTVYGLVYPNSKIHAAGTGQSICRGSCMLVVLHNPGRHYFFIFR